MIEHHLQKDILRKLIAVQTAHFAELKPADIDSNSFTYHLQQLMRQKYIMKQDNGTYALTPAGKAVGINIKLSRSEQLETVHSILLLAVHSPEHGWLLRKRRVHPMIGKLGFLHGEPIATEPIAQTASKRLHEKTGLRAEFTPRGSGYIRIFQDSALESFTHFTLLETQTVSGELVAEDSTGSNMWVADMVYDAHTMIPSMKELVAALEDNTFFFQELNYNVAAPRTT